MANYAGRLDRLEVAMAPRVAPPICRRRVIVRVGETIEQAAAEYAATHGIAEAEVMEDAIYWVLVAPPGLE